MPATEKNFALFYLTDGSGIICPTIGRTILFSQVELPTINHHPCPGPVPMFVRYPRHRP
jgi:hypothetical protein